MKMPDGVKEVRRAWEIRMRVQLGRDDTHFK
jgi:hypothetical protein